VADGLRVPVWARPAVAGLVVGLVGMVTEADLVRAYVEAVGMARDEVHGV
jgi:glycerol kinase